MEFGDCFERLGQLATLGGGIQVGQFGLAITFQIGV